MYQQRLHPNAGTLDAVLLVASGTHFLGAEVFSNQGQLIVDV